MMNNATESIIFATLRSFTGASLGASGFIFIKKIMNITVETTVRPSPNAPIVAGIITGEPFLLFAIRPMKKPNRRIVETIAAA